MITQLSPLSAASLAKAASLLRAGQVVAFPTETVYGLGANALDADAVRRIFAAKERPADNPLIAHIATREELSALTRFIDRRAHLLMDAFWPGPLTLIFPKSSRVPSVVSAGLDTVAVRMPSHPAAQALLRETGLPIAAPSANRSGRPSPTTAQHVLEDMDGRIPFILDGGTCGVGVESTVLDLTLDPPMVLRPGGITVEQLRAILPDVRVSDAVLRPLTPGMQARSPGMKHRHYAPKARVWVVQGSVEAVSSAIRSRYDVVASEGARPIIFCSDAHAPLYPDRLIRPLGPDEASMAANLFSALRETDEQNISLILAEATGTAGMGLALMNRLLRAADFDVFHAT